MGTVGNLAGLNASALHCTIQKCLGATCLCAELGDLHAVSPRSTNFTMRKRGAVHALGGGPLGERCRLRGVSYRAV